MMPPQAPTKIDVEVANKPLAQLPASLEQRLGGSPTRSPDELAAELKAHEERTDKLRRAHLDAVRDRAARESQRAAEAAARKLRLAASRVEKIQRKLVAAESKTNAKREATQAERDARKARRNEMAQAVAEARRAAVEARELKSAKLLENEKLAFAKHAKLIKDVQSKSSAQVRHAIAVVAAQKEKERMEKEAKAESLTARLEKAAAYRETASPATDKAASPATDNRRMRVLNDSKVASAMKKLSFDARSDRASSKRAALLQATQLKCQTEHARIASVVSGLKTQSTDEAKSAHFDKLLRVEVSRLSQLKEKAAKFKKGETVSAIIVRAFESENPRSPPAALTKRLSVVAKNLVATAEARQAGAAARRAALKAAAALKASAANRKHFAASARVGKAAAALAVKVKSKAAAATVALALLEGQRLHAQKETARKALEASSRRAAAEKAVLAKAAAFAAKSDAADERHQAKLRAAAKTGVVAVRAAAFKSRRLLADGVVAATAAKKAARCVAASEKRAALLAARVALAKKRQAAMHGKREVADMELAEAEVKSEYSDC